MTDGEQVLICAGCGVEAPPDAKGWQSHLGYHPREDEWPEAFLFCPECAEREFWHPGPCTLSLRA